MGIQKESMAEFASELGVVHKGKWTQVTHCNGVQIPADEAWTSDDAVELKGVKNFNIEQIMASGQCFRFYPNPYGAHHYVVAYGKVLKVEQYTRLCLCEPAKIDVTFHCTPDEFSELWFHYFDLATDYGAIQQAVEASGDEYLIAAAQYGKGIRILRQDTWEMLASFILSTANNIVRISQLVEALCQEYGTPIHDTKLPFEERAFPTPEQLIGATEQDFRQMKMGFRAKALYEAVQKAAAGELNDVLKHYNLFDQLEDGFAKKLTLTKLTGVGEKVANCVLLFGCYDIAAFPIDTWISKALDKHYPNGFPIQQFEGFQGIIQQYMYFYERARNTK